MERILETMTKPVPLPICPTCKDTKYVEDYEYPNNMVGPSVESRQESLVKIDEILMDQWKLEVYVTNDWILVKELIQIGDRWIEANVISLSHKIYDRIHNKISNERSSAGKSI